MAFFYSCTLRRKMYLVTRSGSAQPAGTQRTAWRSGEFQTQRFLQGRGNKFPDGQHYITKLLQGKTSLDIVKRLAGHLTTRALSWSWRWVNKFYWEMSFAVFISVSSFKCTSASRVGGTAHQQLQYQCVLGAAASQQPERHRSGVQGEPTARLTPSVSQRLCSNVRMFIVLCKWK